jgi:hypothetical protein
MISDGRAWEADREKDPAFVKNALCGENER